MTDTYEKRVDFGENSIFWASADAGSDAAVVNRDVFFIQTRRADDSVMVYRNEDTGWGWPPYFKFDTSNLQAEAADMKSTPETPKWALITHYGWRNEFLTTFPNAISIRPIDGPEAAKPVPWVNIVILTLVAAVFWAIRVRWVRFRRGRIDPVVEEWQDNIEAAGDAVIGKQSRIKKWFGR